MNVRVRVEPPNALPFEKVLEAPEIVIGRATTSGLVVSDTSVSRQHARLFERDGQWWLQDLGATNGTWINGQPLKGEASVQAGDQLRVGETILLIDHPRRSDSGSGQGLPLSGGTTNTGQISLESLESDRQAARLRTLNDIHRALATPISQSDLLDLILERSFEVLRPEEGVILLRDKDGEMRPAATRQRPGVTGEIVISRRVIDEVAGKAKPVLVQDAAVDDRFAGSHSIIGAGVRSVLAAPLTDADGTLGLIALCSRVNIRKFAQPDLEMLVSLASAAVLRMRNIALADEAAERRVLEHELALAHEIQMAMLPRRFPEHPEIELAASLVPARSVGGDLYDFVLDDDRLWFMVGDVSGKGVPAALGMAVAKALFRATAVGEATPATVLGRMNHELSRDNERMVFVTALVGHLRLSSGELTLGDAGHNPAMLVRDRRLQTIASPKGVALGVVSDATYEEGTFGLKPGDALVLYTDGATDARNRNGELFGAARLEQAIGAAPTGSAQGFLAAVAKAVDNFAAGAPPEDDLTLLALRYRGRE